MIWRKVGNIFPARNMPAGMVSHASVPMAETLDDYRIRIYFSARDAGACSHLMSLDMDIREPGKILDVSPSPLMSPGGMGCFDDSGVMGCCLVQRDNEKYLYYVGWNLGRTVPFRNAIGLAVWDDRNQRFERLFQGPVLDRTRLEPHFTASCHVRIENSIYRIWYSSCVGWELRKGKPFHRYHVKYAESFDGIDWQRDGTVALDFIAPYEYAISVPRVIKEGGLYKAWFSSRAGKHADTYRIGYAESGDGVVFSRCEDRIEIDVSEKGWDSEMVCYPFIFDVNGSRYMLYNGNGYGLSGFGLAVLEQD